MSSRADAGARFSTDRGATHPYRGTGITVPTLAEVLEQFPRIPLLIEIKTKAAAELLRRLGATGKTLIVDVKLDEKFQLSARNIAGVSIVPSAKLTARDVMNTTRIIATRAAVERLQEVLA